MELKFIQDNAENPKKLIEAINAEVIPLYDSELSKEYDPVNHGINDPVKRRDKWIVQPNPYGILDTDGNVRLETKIEPVARVAIPLQQLLVRRTVTYSIGGNIELKAPTITTTDKELFELINDCWDDNKLNYKNKTILTYRESESECAELWYTEIDEDGLPVLKMKILAPSLGDTLRPIKDSFGKLIGFAREYKVANSTFYDVYTVEKCYQYYSDKDSTSYQKRFGKSEGENDYDNSWFKVLKYGKLPIIYHSRYKTLWTIIQPLINRLETLISNHADTNDYNGSPILFSNAEVLSFAAKGEQGKFIETKNGGDLKYVTWDSAPESIKMEIDNLRYWIFTCLQVADISFEQMKGLGALTGAALDRILIDMAMLADDIQTGQFGECIQRRINFQKAGYISFYSKLNASKKLKIKPVFNTFKIDDFADKIDIAVKALAGGVIDQLGAIILAGTSDDPQKTLDAINAVIQQKQTDALNLAKATIIQDKQNDPATT